MSSLNRNKSARRLTYRTLVVALMSGMGAACTSRSNTVELEVYNWWEQPSEAAAFARLVQIHESEYPNVDILNEADPNSSNDRYMMANRLLYDAPPATFQANIGADLLRWTVVDTDGSLPSTSRLAPLTAAFERAGLNQNNALPNELLSQLKVGGAPEPYAIPINIHRLNMVYYNVARLGAFQARHAGQSFLDPTALCPADRSAKLDVSIAVATTDRFELNLFVLESLLPALSGSDFYDGLFHGEPAANWMSEVERALACAQYLSQSFTTEMNSLDWAAAARLVAHGDADFTVMGDWVNGELKDELDDGTVGAVPFPGSEGIFVFTSDTFPLPLHAPHEQETLDLLNTIGSINAQLAFSQEKGSIPARFDIPLASLSAREQSTRQAFVDDTKLLATSGLFPLYYPTETLNQDLLAMCTPHAGQAEIDAVMTLLADAEPLLAMWQARLAMGPAQPVGP